MKKFLYLAGLILLSAVAGLGQTNIPTFQYVNAAPSGLCPSGQTQPIQIVYTSGLAYSCNAGVWGPFAGTGGTGATLPTNAMVFGLSPLTSRAAVPNQDFVSPVVTNGMAPTGTAVTGTNFSSNIFTLSGSYCTGSPCAPGQDSFSITNTIGTGVNPTSTLNFSHFGSSGVASGLFNFPISVPNLSDSALTNGDCVQAGAGGILTPASGPCGSGGGTPGGDPTAVQFNNTGAFGGDDTFTFTAGSHTLGVLNSNYQANGIATGSANQNSGQMVMEGDVWNGTAGVGVFYGQQVLVGTGTNANSIMNYNCSSPGPCGAQFNYSLSAVNNVAVGDKSNVLASGMNVYNNMPGLSAAYFGAYGDAFSPPDGLGTTASSTTLGCPDACFLSTDVGKEVWVQGAGASGLPFHATITAFTNSTTATVSAAATATLPNAHGIYGHDDTTAINACILYSSQNAVQCWLRPQAAPSGQNGLVGFLVDGTLHLTENNAFEEASGPSLVGNSQFAGTNIFCENNGDCQDLAAGPIQGANVVNIDFEGDPTQPNSRGIHANPSAGAFGNGPFTNSNYLNVSVNNFSQECLWLDGGGGPGYAFNLPNQYLTFNQLFCSGPAQSHPANMIKMTGQAAQIILINGQVNGQAWNGSSAPNYPNPMISITEKTSGLGDTPVDVKFFGYTYEVCTQGLFIGNGANNIHFDSGYVENCSTPYIVTSATANTFNGNHIANSGNIGAVVQFSTGAGGSVRDTQVYGGVAPPAAFAACSGTNQIDFANNYIASGVTTSAGCATVTSSTGSSALTVTDGTTASVTATGGAIQTISATAVSPGKTLTLYGPSGFQLASGGNIAFGNYTSPVNVPSGGSVILTLLDSGVTFLITDAPPPGAGSPNWSTIVHGTNTDLGAFATAGSWTFSGNVYHDSSSGLVNFQFGPDPTPSTSGSTCVYDSGNFVIDGTCNGNRGLFFQGQFGTSYIAAFRPASGTSVLEIGLNGSLLNPAGNFQSIRGPSSGPAALDALTFSSGGTPLATCSSTIAGYTAVVSDATSPTYMGAYTSGGGITAAVICSFDGTTYAWLTH